MLLWIVTGFVLPLNAGCEAWVWLLLSGVVGYFLGDWCLFNSYLVIGSRFGQLFMTLAPAFTAFFAWVMIGQTLSWNALTAMLITLSGIGIAVTDRGGTEEGKPVRLKGVLLGIGAALGQGLGLVMSKIGLDHFTSNITADELEEFGYVLPFGSNRHGLLLCLVSGEQSAPPPHLLRIAPSEKYGSRLQGHQSPSDHALFGSVSGCRPISGRCSADRSRHCLHTDGDDSDSDSPALSLAFPSANHLQSHPRRPNFVCGRIAFLPTMSWAIIYASRVFELR